MAEESLQAIQLLETEEKEPHVKSMKRTLFNMRHFYVETYVVLYVCRFSHHQILLLILLIIGT